MVSNQNGNGNCHTHIEEQGDCNHDSKCDNRDVSFVKLGRDDEWKWILFKSLSDNGVKSPGNTNDSRGHKEEAPEEEWNVVGCSHAIVDVDAVVVEARSAFVAFPAVFGFIGNDAFAEAAEVAIVA